ncbi:TPA: Fic family protein [Streptococcus suis]|nr:cell filamentation protein Fic [Streptococcus suis]HEM5985120.1 Fic family protein [Streptococcus suis]HEM6111320.1 Fic family protein [Streptococcus suis]HEM6265206.1 Fic family protein [Streptococcus suis]HEM6319092.1 Fic family protein [Streptococcus suis]
MARKTYEGYEYLDSENQYTYPNSSVLINKLGITNPIKAQRNEHLLVTKRLSDLRIKPIEIHSIKDVLAVHHYLFQDLYSWAGQYRTVNISKSGNAFMPIQSFGASEIFLNKLIENFHQSAHSRSEVIQQLAEILDNLNYYHPFREGNGRTQREVIRSLALSKGYRAQIRVEADDDIYHLYMDGTVQGDLEILKQLFDKILEKL